MSSVFCQKAANQLTIDQNEIHIWRVNCEDFFAQVDVTSKLTPEELQRGARLINENDQRRFWSAHAGLRIILSAYVAAEPQRIKFNQNPYGKPYIQSAINLQFNMSHSGDFVLYALSNAQDVGVDIEMINTEINYQALAARFFAANEYEYLLTYPETEQAPVFYKIWVRKEAYLKALGLGLRQSLSSFSVLNNPAIIDLPADLGYAAALALVSTHGQSLVASKIQYWQLASAILGEF